MGTGHAADYPGGYLLGVFHTVRSCGHFSGLCFARFYFCLQGYGLAADRSDFYAVGDNDVHHYVYHHHLYGYGMGNGKLADSQDYC